MSANRHALGSNLDKIDGRRIAPEDYDEIPELGDEWFAEADVHFDGKLVRRGRPKAAEHKVPVSLRLSPDVLTRFKATGRGWQTRIDAILSQWLADHPEIGNG